MTWLGDLGSAILGFAYEQRVALATAAVPALAILVLLARRLRWFAAMRAHPLATTVVGVPVLLVATPVLWYLVSPIFVTSRLEEPPIVVAAASPGPLASASAVRPAASSPPAATTAPTATPIPTAPPWVPAPDRAGTFVGTDDFHFGRGTAILREVAPGQWTIRFEGFAVRNGPDLYVYLSPDPKAYIPAALEVARLRAAEGSYDTALPPGIDPRTARSVLIWCKQFSHLFAFATLPPAG